MTDKCIVHGCQNHKHQGSFEGGLCAPCYRMLTTGNPKFGTSFVHHMEARILADAKVIEAAKELARLFDSCIKEMMSAYHDQFDGVWIESDFEKVESPYREALAAFSAAAKGEE